VLSSEEMDALACWIDLGVPFAGDYTEGMDEASAAVYRKSLAKRKRWEVEESGNIEAMLNSGGTR